MIAVTTIETKAFCYDRDIGTVQNLNYSSSDRASRHSLDMLPKQQSKSVGRTSWGYDNSRHRKQGSESKSITLRTWRNPRSLGGKNPKSAAIKVARRLSQQRFSLLSSGKSKVLVSWA